MSPQALYLDQLEQIGEGSRVAIYLLPGSSLDERILRIPHDPLKDGEEIKNLSLLEKYLTPNFFPNPVRERYIIDGYQRMLISSDRLYAKYSSSFTNHKRFMKHFEDLEGMNKIDFLVNLHQFISQCKNMYYKSGFLPDIVGRGNFIPYESSQVILDYNNADFERNEIEVAGEIHIPTDDRGVPIFDLALRILYNLEKGLLTYGGNNFSTAEFNRWAQTEAGFTPDSLHRMGIFKLFEDLKTEQFYGAVRYKARREAAEKLRDNAQEGGLII